MNAKELDNVPFSAADVLSIAKQLASGSLSGRWLVIRHTTTRRRVELRIDGGRMYTEEPPGCSGVMEISPKNLQMKNRPDAWLILGLRAGPCAVEPDSTTDLGVMLPPISGAGLVTAYARAKPKWEKLAGLMAGDVAKPASYVWQREVRVLMHEVAELLADGSSMAASRTPKEVRGG